MVAAGKAIGEAQRALAKGVRERAVCAADEGFLVIRQVGAARNCTATITGRKTGAVERHPGHRRLILGKVVNNGDLRPRRTRYETGQCEGPSSGVKFSFHQQPPMAPRLQTPLVT